MSSSKTTDLDRAGSAGKQSFDIATRRRLLAACGLFLAAPLVAEFLLGNMSITHLGMLGVMAPLYGGGALLIREAVRRARRGWSSIFILALAYGILEEAFLTQSLFNPDFLAKHLHLLDSAYLPGLGIGAWYTVFVLTLHTVWSIPVPIALIESLVPNEAEFSWLGRAGLGAVAAAFIAACFSIAHFTTQADPAHFFASRSQFGCSAVIIAILITVAFALPRRPLRESGRIPHPAALGLGAFAAAIGFWLVPQDSGWWAVLAYCSIDALAAALIWRWSRFEGWRAVHKLALAGGAAMVYAIHAFIQTPSIGDAGTVARIGNLIFAALATALIALGLKRTRVL